MLKTTIWTLSVFLSPLLAWGQPRIALNFSYKGTSVKTTAGKGILQSGETLVKEFGRGDIDTVLTLTPTFKEGDPSKSIYVEINVKNFRDGDLISESTPEVLAEIGKPATVTLKDPALNEAYKLSVTAKTLR